MRIKPSRDHPCPCGEYTPQSPSRSGSPNAYPGCDQIQRDRVRSSIARRIGMDMGTLAQADRHVDGVVEMMLDATQR